MQTAKPIRFGQLVSTYNGKGTETQTLMNEDSPSPDRVERGGCFQIEKNNLSH